MSSSQQLGANFIGFVLVQKSKRFVDLKKLESLSIMVRKPSSSVALLADPSDDFLEKTAYDLQSGLHSTSWRRITEES